MKKPSSTPPIDFVPISNIVSETKVGKKDVEILKRDFEKHGQLVAVILSPAPEGFSLEAGAKRLEAAKAAGWKEIKATIIANKDGDDYDSATIREWVKLIESHQRYEMSDYDLAKAAVQMEDKHQIKGSEFARQVGLSNGYTYNLMRWYRMAPEKVRDAWKAGNPLINQAELERYSHMAKADTVEAWDLRLRMRASAFEPYMPGGKNKQNGNGPHASMSKHKPRRASERQISQLQQAIDDSVLTEPVKQLCGNMLKFVLGVEKNVPGITDYQKLPLTIISKDALKEKERSAS